jgi:hypothetical protein
MVRAGGRAINVRHRHETARLRCPLFARYRRQTGHHTDGSIRSSSDSQLHLADLRLVEQTIPGWLHHRRPRISTLPSDCDLRQQSLGIMPRGDQRAPPMRSCSTLPTAITTRGDALSIIATRSASLLRMPSRRRKTSGGWAEGEEVIISDKRGDTMRSWITVCVGAVLFVQPAAAGTIDERVFSAFGALCLDNMSEIGRVPSFAGAIGMVELSGEKAKLLLDGHPGHAWISGAKETARYALILTDEGSCGVTGPDANGKDVMALFLSNSRNQRLSTEKTG